MTGERVRTLIIVTIVSVLVWLFAESRTLRMETLDVPVTVSEGGRALVYRILDEDWNGVVEMELTGPTAQIDELRALALDTGLELVLGGELPSDPGERDVDLRDALRRNATIDTSGITIRRVIPDQLRLEVDRLESVTVPVELDLGGVETVGPVRVTPSEITIGLPASIAATSDPVATARIDPARLTALEPGERIELSQVPIRSLGLPEGTWGLRFDEPRLVSVSLELPARTGSHVIPELPVYVSLTPTDLSAWVVEVPPEDRVLTQVTVTGPLAAIGQVRRGDLPLTATVRITSDDLARGVQSAPVRIVGLPPGVVADLAGREVAVSVRRRSTPAGE